MPDPEFLLELDGVPLKGVRYFRLESEHNAVSELTVRLMVDDLEVDAERPGALT
jgi:hypothetical protein